MGAEKRSHHDHSISTASRLATGGRWLFRSLTRRGCSFVSRPRLTQITTAGCGHSACEAGQRQTLAPWRPIEEPLLVGHPR